MDNQEEVHTIALSMGRRACLVMMQELEEATHTSYEDIPGAENFRPIAGDVGLAGRKALATGYGTAKGSGTADVDPDTGKATVASQVTAANQGRGGLLPQTPAQEAADKVEAEKKITRELNAEGLTETVNRAEAILTGPVSPTGSGLGKLVDNFVGWFGKSTKGAQKAAALKVVSAKLVMMGERFEGSQSEWEVAQYLEAAGSIGNDKIPIETRMATLNDVRTMLGRWEKTAGRR